MKARTYVAVVGIIAFIACTTHGLKTSRPTLTASTSSTNETGEISPLSADDIKLILDSHNRARNMERAPGGIPLLTWSSQLALRAQNWTDECNFAHQPPGTRKWGENMAAMSNSKTKPDQLTTMFKQWLDEKRYNIDKTFEECCSFQSNTCCHYTQVIWSRTTTVGCGYSMCDNMVYGTGTLSNMVYLACYYFPAGNVPIVTYDWRPYPTASAARPEPQSRTKRV